MESLVAPQIRSFTFDAKEEEEEEEEGAEAAAEAAEQQRAQEEVGENRAAEQAAGPMSPPPLSPPTPPQSPHRHSHASLVVAILLALLITWVVAFGLSPIHSPVPSCCFTPSTAARSSFPGPVTVASGARFAGAAGLSAARQGDRKTAEAAKNRRPSHRSKPKESMALSACDW